MTTHFITIEQALLDLKYGRMVILVDDEGRENEGDLVIAAEYVTAQSINFMTRFCSGVICLPMHASLIDKLNLPMMTQHNRSPFGTPFTVSIEAASGVSTGISAQDRAHTIHVAIDPKSEPSDIISPGHMFPLRAHDGGVLKRAGHTEASVDLMTLAGLTKAAVICELVNPDGSMSRRNQLIAFSREHDIPIVSIKDLIEYRIRHEQLVEPVVTTQLPLNVHGDFTMTLYSNQLDTAEHFALVKQGKSSNTIPLVRIHSECITGDVFGSCKCDCGSQLQQSLELIAAEGGVLIYLRQEGRGVGLANKLKAYALQDQGHDTVDANLLLGLPVDSRNYAVAFQILKHMNIKTIRLLTNNPNKVSAMTLHGIIVVERIPLLVPATHANELYLKTKQTKLGHFLEIK